MSESQEKYVVDMSFDAEKVDKGIKEIERKLKNITGDNSTRAIRIRATYENLKRDLAAAKKTLNTAIKSGDQEVIIKTKVDEATLQGALIKVRKELREADKAVDIGIYKKKSAELIKLRNDYKDLALSQGETSEGAKKLLGDIQRLDGQLKKLDGTVGQNQRNVGNYKSGFEALSAELKKSKIEYSNVVKAQGKNSSSALELKRNIDSLKGSINNLNKADKSISFDGLTGKVKGLLVQVGLAAGAGQAVSSSFSAAISFEQVETQFEVLFGSVEKGQQMLKELTEFAKVTPFTIPGVRDSAAQLKAYGFASEEIIPTLRKVGDISRGNQDIFNRLTYALGQVRSAGKLYGTELRQFTETGIPLMEELGKVHGVAASEIRNMVEDGKISYDDVVQAMTNLTSEGGQFAGLMEKQSKTVAGAWSNLKDSVTQAQEQIAKSGFYESIRQGLLSLADNLPSILEGFGKFFSMIKSIGSFFLTGWTGTIIKGLASTAVAIYGITKAMGALNAVIAIGRKLIASQMVLALKAWVIGLNAGTISIGRFVIANKAMIVGLRLLRAAIIATGIGAVIVAMGVAVEKLSGALDEFNEKNQKTKDSISGLGERFKNETDIIQEELKKVQELEWNLAEKINTKEVEEAREKIVSELSKVGQEVGIAEKDIRARLKQYNDAYPETLSVQGFNNFVQEISGKIDELDKSLEGGVITAEAMFNRMNNAQRELSFEEMKQKIIDANIVIDGQYSQLFERLSENASNAGDLAASINFAIASGMSSEEGLKMIREAGGNLTTEQYNALVPEMRNTIDEANQEARKIIEGAIEIDSSKGAFKSAGNNVIANLINGLDGQKPKLVQTLKNLATPINSFIEGVSGIDVGKLFSRFSTAASNVASKIKDSSIGGNLLAEAQRIQGAISEAVNIKRFEDAKNSIIEISDEVSSLAKEQSLSSSGRSTAGSSGASTASKIAEKEAEDQEDRIKDLTETATKAEEDLTKTKEKHSEKRQKAEEEYADVIQETQEEIDSLEEKHSDMAKSVKKDLRDLKNELSELEKGFNETLKETNDDFSSNVATRVQELKKEIKELEKEKTEIDISNGPTEEYLELLQKIKETKDLIAEGSNLVTDEDLKKAKEYSELSEFEQLQFDNQERINQITEEFEAEKALLQEKEKIQEAYLAGKIESIEKSSEYKTQLYLEELKQEDLNYKASALEKGKILIELQKAHEDHLDYIGAKEETAVNNSIKRWQRAEIARKEALGEDGSLEDLKYQVSNSSTGELEDRLSGVEDIQSTEAMLHNEKIDYYRAEYEEHRLLVEGQKASLAEMIDMIKQATIAQEQLNSLRESAQESASSSDNRTYTINQNIQSKAQADLYAKAVRNAQ